MRLPSLPRLVRADPPADAWLAALLSVVVFTLDLSLTSFARNFDGVACAIAIESGNLRHLAHGNHVLYGLFGWAFDALWRAFGYDGRALAVLDVLNRLLHAACAGLAFQLLRALRLSRRGALYGAAGLALSHAIWFYALEPHVYLLGLAGLLAASAALFRSDPRPAAAGVFHALAVGGHATHVLFLPAALYWLATGPGDRRRAVLRYLAAFALGLAVVYGLGALAVRPGSVSEVLRWLAGTATVGGDRSFRWHGVGGFDPAGWAIGFVGSIWAQSAQDGFFVNADPAFPLQALATLTCLAVGFAQWPLRPRLAASMALWLGAYALFFSTWEPRNMNYALACAVPLWTMLAIALDGRADLGRTILALAALAVAGHNHAKAARRHLDPAFNPWLGAMRVVRDATPPEAWIATRDDIGKVYLPYFAERKPLVLADEPSRPEVLELREPVYVLPHVLDDGVWRERLESRFRLQPADAGDLKLVRLERKR